MKRFLLFIGLLFSVVSIYAQAVGDYRSNSSSGNWSNLANWERLNALPNTWATPTPAQGYPGQEPGTGTVTIQNDHSITVDVSPVNPISALVLSPSNKSTNLFINTSLNVTNGVTINPGTASNNTSVLSILGPSGMLNCASVSIPQSGSDSRTASLKLINGGTVNVSGNVTMGASGVRSFVEFLFNGGNLNIGGTMTGGNLVPGTGTVNFNSTGPITQLVPVYSYHNIHITNGAFTINRKELAGNLALSGDLVITNGLLDLNNGNISVVNCTVNNNSVLLTSGNGVISGTALNLINGCYLEFSNANPVIPTFTTYNIENFSRLVFNSNGNQSGIDFLGLSWGHVDFNQTGIKTIISDLTATDISIRENVTLETGSHIINMKPTGFGASASLDGTLTGTGKIIISNSNNFTINSSGNNPFKFYDLEMNTSGVHNLILQKNIEVSNTLTLTNGRINTQTHTLTLSNAAEASQISGGSNSSYVYSTGAGRLVRQGLAGASTPFTFPVGSSSHFMPVVFAASGADGQTVAVNVFQGISTNGVEGGPQFSDKSSMVDAVWNIDRTAGTGDAEITVQWDASLEGAAFSTFTGPQIGISRNESGTWQVAIGSGDNTANTATATFSSFSPFGVGGAGFVLPLKLLSFEAGSRNCVSNISWKTANEVNVNRFELQVSYDGQNWTTIHTIQATNGNSNVNNYSYTYDHSARSGNKQLRLKMVDNDGKTTYSKVIGVQCGKDNVLSFYPNPATDRVTITGTSAGEQIRLVSIDGKLLKTATATAGNTTLGLEGLSTGTYLLQVVRGGELIPAGKLVKQ